MSTPPDRPEVGSLPFVGLRCGSEYRGACFRFSFSAFQLFSFSAFLRFSFFKKGLEARPYFVPLSGTTKGNPPPRRGRQEKLTISDC